MKMEKYIGILLWSVCLSILPGVLVFANDSTGETVTKVANSAINPYMAIAATVIVGAVGLAVLWVRNRNH